MDHPIDEQNLRRNFKNELYSAIQNDVSYKVDYFLNKRKVDVNEIVGINSYLHCAIKHHRLQIIKKLLDCGAIITPEIFPPFHWVNVFIIKLLLDYDVDVHVKDLNGATYLHLAVTSQLADIVDILIKKGADINAVTNSGQTVLQMAFQTSDEKIIKRLLDCDFDVCAQDQNKDTPLHYAVNLENIEFTKLIIEKGAYVNVAGKYAKIPLHLAVLKNNIKHVKLLLEHGADINSRTIEWKIPLHLAVAEKSIEIVKLLLENGADVNDCTETEITPLHIAVDSGYKEMVMLLVNNNANVNAIGMREETPLNIAVAYEHEKIAEYLIFNGAIVNHGLKKDTLLHMAVFNKNEKLVRLLLDNNADVSVKYRDGMTPLHMAMNCKCSKIAEMLLKKDADVNDCTETGDTALHLATENEDQKTIEILLNFKPNINLKNNLGKTALYIAAEKGLLNIMSNILNHKPDINENKLALHFAVSGRDILYKKIILELISYGFSLDFVHAYDQEQIFDFIEKSVSNGHSGIVENLLKNGFDPNTPTNFKNNNSLKTLLHYAVDNSQLQNTKLLLEYGSNVNATDKNGNSPLFYSIAKNNLEIMRLLLDNKATIDNDHRLFFMVVAKGNSGIIREFLNHFKNINVIDEFGMSALHHAAWNEDEESIQLLLDKGIKFETSENLVASSLKTEMEKIIREEFGEDMVEEFRKNMITTPLHMAARKNNCHIVKALLEYGFKVNCRDSCGRTPLHIASLFNKAEVVNVLIEYGADLQAVDHDGFTCINYACKSEFFISNYLLDKIYVFLLRSTVVDRIISNLTTALLLIKYLALFNSKNKICNENLLHYHTKFQYFYEDCHIEIEVLKSKTFCCNVTFYDILTKNIDVLASYMKNKDFIQSYKSQIQNSDFIIFKSILDKRINKAKERRLILDETEIYCTNILCLPDLLTMKIISYLHNRDLRNIKEAYELSFNQLEYCKCKES